MRGIAVICLLATVVLGKEPDFDVSVEFDPSGVWHSKDEDLVVRRTGRTSWMGYPTEGRGLTSGRTWHFQAIGGSRFQFWILLEGKATTQKLDDQTVEFSGKQDEMTLSLTGKRGKSSSITFHRVLAKVPSTCESVTVTFIPPGRGKYQPDQDIDVRLVRALERAIHRACEADPDLKRLNVVNTIDRNTGVSKTYSRFIRRGMAIDRVNGADADNWREDVAEKTEALEEGGVPKVDRRRDYARHVTALVLALLLEEEVEQVICPAVLTDDTIPYLEWWIGRYGRDMPGSPSVVGFREKIDAMLKATRSARSKLKNWLHVSVRKPKEPPCRHRKALEKRYDRE